jgi:hypothetical protein
MEGERFAIALWFAAGCVPISSNLRMLSDLLAAPASAATPWRCSRAARREAGADRRQHPLVQRAAVEVAFGSDLEREVAKACAPSTIVWMPRARAIRAMSRTGNSCPVRLVMWQMWMIFVFGGIARDAVG